MIFITYYMIKTTFFICIYLVTEILHTKAQKKKAGNL